MIRNRFVFLIVAVLCASTSIHCRPGKNKIARIWFFTFRQSVSSASNIKQEANHFLTAYALNPSNFFCLQPDNNYTMYFKEFESGRWDVKGNEIVLTPNGGMQMVLEIFRMDDKELTFVVPGNRGDTYTLHFEGWPIGTEDNEGNPFSADNNQWRLKAMHKETDEEIAKRLRNHFRYWEKYFNWGLTSGRHSLDVRSLQGPLKMYGNGFGLIPYEEESAEWLSHFYDEEDSRKAYNKIKYLFDHENIAWANTDNKFKMFISAFQQMQEKIK